jgi:glyoxylase-like metal-dependent hydrolase (beta-lactamase superfamily II)
MNGIYMINELNLKTDISIKPEIFPFFHKKTNTFSYIVKDPSTNNCAIIDSVIDFNYSSGTISFESADKIINYLRAHNLNIEWIIETHVHADHLSAASHIQEHMGGKIGIGSKIITVQTLFAEIFNLGNEFHRDGSQFDRLFEDGDTYQIGDMVAYVIHTPGHTPACMTHIIGDAAFVGDTLFMPDIGTARADFPGGNAKTLFQSIKKLLSLPSQTRLFMCHDYPENLPDGKIRNVEYETSVEKENTENIHVHKGISEDEFVNKREARDATLEMPKLILPSLQINMRAGHLPPPEDNNKVYLKLPINAFS